MWVVAGGVYVVAAAVLAAGIVRAPAGQAPELVATDRHEARSSA
jgi:hypothetical protein